MQAAIRTCDAYILRVPGMVSHLVWSEITHLGRPYAVEVVGDPHAVFAPQSVEHPLRPFFRWWFAHQLRRQCAGACASAYVTEQTLQRLYPCPSYSVGVSDAVIPDTALVPAARALRQGLRTFTLVTVASLAQPYKALDVLIDAVGVCVREGMDQKLIVVGDGKHRKELEVRAARLGLGERVQFLGELTSGDAVRARLDEADVFVLPSRTEGLPRAMIEAMARAVPCIGSKVGGIPELLPPEDMVPPGDVAALARKIRDVATNPGRMARMSARNLEKAKEFRQHTLRERRIAFYRHGRERTEEWMSASGIA